jgi:hypothetical protein
MPEPADHRAALAESQAKLAAALAGGQIPNGFDADRVKLAAQALIAKRRRVVAHLLPTVATSLGEQFVILFDAYVETEPHPPDERGIGDAAGFLRRISESQLIDSARIEVLFFRLRHGRLAAATWLPQKRAIAVGLRIPFAGSRVVHLRLWPSPSA